MTAPGLDRFVAAQEGVYETALGELRAGTKRSHWMWFIFPQLAGLSHSSIGKAYAIAGLAEAKAYLAHELLGPRLAECTGAMLSWAGKREAEQILGHIDAMKFASSMTLFEAAADGNERFGRALEAFYAGERDQLTLDLLAR
jgi:uncharacterized protein (DUF1810 family)